MDSEQAPPTPPSKPPRIFGLGVSVLCGLVLVGVLTLTLAGRSILAPPAPLTLLITFLPYVVASGVLISFVGWILAPDRWAPPLTLVGHLALGGLLWGSTFPAFPEVGVAGTELTVMEWNVRRLWGGSEDGGDPESCVVEAIEAVNPDALTLLEVTAEDVDRLSERLGMTCAHTDYLGKGAPDAGGLATCVRGSTWRIASHRVERFTPSEAWSYVVSELRAAEQTVHLAAVHLQPLGLSGAGHGLEGIAAEVKNPLQLLRAGETMTRMQGVQAAALLETVTGLSSPTIIAGDFNSVRDAALHVRMRAHLTDAWERGGRGLGPTIRLGDWVPLRVDYIYLSPAFAVEHSEVGSADCSDHRPVVSELVLRAP